MSACGSSRSVSLVCLGADVESGSASSSAAFVLQLLPRHSGVAFVAGVELGRLCIEGAGGHWCSRVSAPCWWKMVGGSVSLPRLRRVEKAVLRSGDGPGASPRPACHKDEGFATGELVHKADRQRGGLAGLRLVVFVVLASGGCSGGLGGGRRLRVFVTEDPRDRVVLSFSFRVLCANVCGHLGFQCLLVYAYVPCTANVFV